MHVHTQFCAFHIGNYALEALRQLHRGPCIHYRPRPERKYDRKTLFDLEGDARIVNAAAVCIRRCYS